MNQLFHIFHNTLYTVEYSEWHYLQRVAISGL